MKCDVVYHSATGNTKKVGKVIAEACQCLAREAKSAEPIPDADIVFLGGAVYATTGHDLHPSIGAFADKLSASKYSGKIAVFSTGFASSDAAGLIKKELKARGLRVSDESYHSEGQFLLFMRGHPDEEDLAAAKAFALKHISN